MSENSPTIVGLSGNVTGATLLVQAPTSVSDTELVSYMIQPYSDASGTTPVGKEVKGVALNGDGTAGSPFDFFVPWPTAGELWFKVTVVMGSVRGNSSALAGSIVVGE